MVVTSSAPTAVTWPCTTTRRPTSRALLPSSATWSKESSRGRRRPSGPRRDCSDRRLGLLQVHGGSDEADVAQGLGEVAQLRSADGIDLLGEEAHIVGTAGDPLEQRAGGIDIAPLGEVVDQPEATNDKGSLVALQSVRSLIPVDQTIRRELAPGPVHRRAHARVVRAEEAHERDQEVRRVKLRCTERLHEGAGPGVHPVSICTATQHITFEITKCRRASRNSQNDSSGSFQRRSTTSITPRSRSQKAGSMWPPYLWCRAVVRLIQCMNRWASSR